MTTITISKGATSYSLTNYLNVNLVLKNSLEIRESEYGSGYTPTINSASFKMLFAGPPASLLLEDDVEVLIARDGDPLFTGYIRPLTGLDFSGMGRADSLSVECLGTMSRLTAEHKGEAVDLGLAGNLVVCNAAMPSTSYVHLMLSRLGWTRGLEAPVIPMTMPIALLRDGDVLLDKLAHTLFCAGHYITELPDGQLSIRPFALEAPVPEKEFSVESRNIIKSLNVTRNEAEEKSVAVTYGKLNRIPEYAIYAEDVRHVVYSRHYSNPSDRKPWVWPYNRNASGEPPYLYKTSTDADWTWKTRYGVVRKKLAADGSETTEDDILIPLPAPNVSGLKEGLWKYASLRAELIFWDDLVSSYGIAGSYRWRGSITGRIASDGSVSYWRTPDKSGNTIPLEADHPLNGAIAASWSSLGLSVVVGPIPYINDDQRYTYLEGLTIYGALEYIHSNDDAIIDSDAPRIVIGTLESGKRLKETAELCIQPADAERIARALYAGLGAPVLKFRSAEKVRSGAIVRVPHASRGIDVIGRVISRTSAIDQRTYYTYETEGLSPLIIESDYYPAIIAGLGIGSSPYQTIADLILARTIQEAQAEKKYYLHIAYATAADGSTGFSTSDPTNRTYLGQCTDTDEVDPETPESYTWSKIQGPQGEQGIPGEDGANGVTYYLHIAYATAADGSTGFSTSDPTNKTYLGQCVDTNSADPTTPGSYTWSKIQGPQGPQGIQGIQGTQGVQGPAGQSQYFHVRYSAAADGTGFSTTPNTYIGTAVTTSPTAPTSKTGYTWTQFKGDQGAQGIQGPTGANGVTYYLHIAYATAADGSTGFSTSDPTNKTYLGQCVDTNSADPTTPGSYTWSKIQGPQGPQGIQGIQGTQGVQGPAGQSQYFHVRYSAAADGTGFSTTPNTYIGTAVTTSPTAPTSKTGYTWTQFKGDQGAQGIQGPTGANGVTYYLHIAYATAADGSTGFSTSDPTNKTYLGQCVDTNSADPTTPGSYTWSKIQGPQGPQGIQGIQGTQGVQGPAGQSQYFHVRYSAAADGTGFSTTPNTYIGTAVTTSPTAPTSKTGYTWTQFKGDQGAQGIQGPTGANGVTYYLHIAYATAADGSTGFSTSDPTNKTYLGQCVDTNSADPTTPGSYTWSKIQGPQGPQGIQGIQGTQGVQGPAGQSQYFHVRYSAAADGTGFSTTPNTYIGTAVTTSPTAPTSKTGYTWTQFKGDQGAQGIQGPTGANGVTYYLHIAYATAADGSTGFSTSDPTNKTYLGQCVDTNSADPTTPGSYTWSKIQGPQGPQGIQGIQGTQGVQGPAGLSVWYAYHDNPPTTAPNAPTGAGNLNGWHENITSASVWVSIKQAVTRDGTGSWSVPAVMSNISLLPSYVPKYLGPGKLSAVTTAVFRRDSISPSGVATSGSNVTSNVGDWMYNYDTSAVSTLSVFRWSGSAWETSTVTWEHWIAATEDIGRWIKGAADKAARDARTPAAWTFFDTIFTSEAFIDRLAAKLIRSSNYQTGVAGMSIDLINAILKAENGKWMIDGTTGKIIALDLEAWGIDYQEIDCGDYVAAPPDEVYDAGGEFDCGDYDGTFIPDRLIDCGWIMGDD